MGGCEGWECEMVVWVGVRGGECEMVVWVGGECEMV